MVTSGDVVPMAIAHRGGAGLAPENTMAAFERSVALGIRHVETDVRATRDRGLALLHDARLHRVAGLEIHLHDCVWADLRWMPVFGGHPIPSLQELLASFPDLQVTVDLKDRWAIEPLALALRRRRDRDRVWVAGAPDRRIAALRERVPTVRTALGWGSLTRLVTAAALGRRVPEGLPAAEYAHLPARLLRDPVRAERLVAMADDLGLGVVAWTVDDAPTIRRLRETGVVGIVADRPDIARDVLIDRGEWVPMGALRRPTPEA